MAVGMACQAGKDLVRAMVLVAAEVVDKVCQVGKALVREAMVLVAVVAVADKVFQFPAHKGERLDSDSPL